MKAMVLAAGLGTRLKPWTLEHPKALVPVGGISMLQRVIERLEQAGFDRILVNIHHFGEQIVDFLATHNFSAEISISDERGLLLDTGGALLHARDFICSDSEPTLIHNVDILSNADLRALVDAQKLNGADATLLVSNRESSRKLMFSPDMALRGWHNHASGEYKPQGFEAEPGDTEHAFSGIYAISPAIIEKMSGYGPVFPVMDFFLDYAKNKAEIRGVLDTGLQLMDIGKPDSLRLAEGLYGGHQG